MYQNKRKIGLCYIQVQGSSSVALDMPYSHGLWGLWFYFIHHLVKIKWARSWPILIHKLIISTQASMVAQRWRLHLPTQEMLFGSGVRKIPWRSACQPTPVFLPGKSRRQRSLASYSPWGHKRVKHNLDTKQHQQS